MEYDYSQLKTYGDPEVSSIRYRNYPIGSCRGIWDFPAENIVLPFYLYSIGGDTWHCKGYSRRTDSSILSLEYVQEGEFVFEQEGQLYHVKSGEMFLVYPGKSSSLYCRPVTARKRMIILKGNMLKMIADDLGLDKIDKFVPHDRKMLDDFYDEIEVLASSGSSASFYRACSLCYNLLVETARSGRQDGYPQNLRRILDFMHSRLYGKLSLKELSSFAGISPTGLNQLFHQYFQTSPIEYFLDRKLELAENLLRQNTKSVKEIAGILSYPSSQYFSFKFKQKYGRTPLAAARGIAKSR